MSKKTIALIVGLVLLTAALLVIALSQNKAPSTPKSDMPTAEATPTPPVKTTLNISPSTLTARAGVSNQVEVQIDTDQNEVTAVQLEIAYEPQAISNVKLTPSAFFTDPVVLLNTNDTSTGRISYALGISPAQEAVKGKGTVATLTFTTNPTSPSAETQITLLPKSLVSARGVTVSVLKSSTGTTITLPQRTQTVPVSPVVNPSSPAVTTPPVTP